MVVTEEVCGNMLYNYSCNTTNDYGIVISENLKKLKISLAKRKLNYRQPKLIKKGNQNSFLERASLQKNSDNQAIENRQLSSELKDQISHNLLLKVRRIFRKFKLN